MWRNVWVARARAVIGARRRNAVLAAVLAMACSGGDGGGSDGAAATGGVSGSAAGGTSGGSGGASGVGGGGTSGNGGVSSGGSGGNASGGAAGGGGSSSGGSAGAVGGAAGAGSGGVGGSAGSAGSGMAGSSGAAATGGAGGAPGTPEVAFIGRVDRRADDDVRFAWPGSAIVFRFSGTQASVILDDAAGFFTVVVDGQEQARLETSPGERTYSVASGLTSGQHEVRLYRRTEALFGVTRYVGLDLGTDGTLLPPPAPASRRIEIIGDSISCGYGNEGPDQYCSFTADTENHYLAYGSITARDLAADLVTVAWSGKGVVYNYQDDKVDPLPSLYDRVLPESSTSLWDFSWQPDVVVINLGTNDFSTDGDPPEQEFVPAYTDFLAHLRDVYPDTEILALAPTLLSGTDFTTVEGYIQTAVDARRTAGDAKVEAFTMTFASSGWGCDWHPSLTTHASMADALTAKLQTKLGW